MIKTCPTCQQDFVPWSRKPSIARRQVYCSPRCSYDSPVRNAKVSKGRSKAARTTIVRKYLKDIREFGFWVTPELIALCQRIDKRARERGNRERLIGEGRASARERGAA